MVAIFRSLPVERLLSPPSSPSCVSLHLPRRLCFTPFLTSLCLVFSPRLLPPPCASRSLSSPVHLFTSFSHHLLIWPSVISFFLLSPVLSSPCFAAFSHRLLELPFLILLALVSPVFSLCLPSHCLSPLSLIVGVLPFLALVHRLGFVFIFCVRFQIDIPAVHHCGPSISIRPFPHGLASAWAIR